MHAEEEEEILEIRRHRNRRLYDTERCRTLTQRELADLVRAGRKVRVVDTATGDDITVEVLAQVAGAEVAGWPDRDLGARMYHTLIAKGGEMGVKAINNVILAGLGALSLTREKAEEIIDTLIKRGDLARGDRKMAVEDLIRKAEEQAKKFSDTMRHKAAELRGVRREEYERLKEEVDSLRRTIERLQAERGEGGA